MKRPDVYLALRKNQIFLLNGPIISTPSSSVGCYTLNFERAAHQFWVSIRGRVCEVSYIVPRLALANGQLNTVPSAFHISPVTFNNDNLLNFSLGFLYDNLLAEVRGLYKGLVCIVNHWE